MPYSGQSLKRFEDFQLLTGRGSFVDDIKLPGLLHALVLRSPHAHARIRSMDVSMAQSLPGVAAVLTAKDIEGTISDPPARREQEGYNNRAPEHPVLAKDKVCYVGQAVAVVVAADLHQATLQNVRNLLGDVTSADALISQWSVGDAPVKRAG